MFHVPLRPSGWRRAWDELKMALLLQMHSERLENAAMQQMHDEQRNRSLSAADAWRRYEGILPLTLRR
jgi:hypothetical protein